MIVDPKINSKGKDWKVRIQIFLATIPTFVHFF